MVNERLIYFLAGLGVLIGVVLLLSALPLAYSSSQRFRDLVHVTGFVDPNDPPKGLRRLSMVGASSVVLVLLVVLAIVLEQHDPHRDYYLPTLRWLDGFAHSPGLGGLAAVGAAFIAFGQWRRQREAERKSRRDQQWWDAFKLIYTEVMAGTVRGLPATLALLDTLAREADTEVQYAAADALIEELLQRN